MISKKNQELQDKLGQAWKASQERQTKMQAARGHFGYIDLHKIAVSTDALELISEETARNLHIVPFALKSNQLYLGVLDPQKDSLRALLKDLQKQGYLVKIFLISKDSLEYAWGFYKFVSKTKGQVSSKVDIAKSRISELTEELNSYEAVQRAIKKSAASSASDAVEVVVAGALALRASDIHFESDKSDAKIRYRIDGVLEDLIDGLSHHSYKLIINRIKLLSSLQLNAAKSQDGRFTFTIGETVIELRVSLIPSEFGETMVIRVLDPRIIQLQLSELGMREDDLAIVDRELKSPNGMILNTGPTGSGKTTTLYAFLHKVANPEIKIITIEDPIEYHLNDIEQTQVDKKRGYTFANGLQAIMRQDPDIILVGEIRDEDTAAVAIQAALTGHVVFSTLHTNSASGVIPRLINLGAPVSSIGAALNLVIAQRLMRRLCEKCKKRVEMTEEIKKNFEKFLSTLPERVRRASVNTIDLYQVNPGGCQSCTPSGYKGRVGIFELLEVGEEIEFLIEKKTSEAEINRFAQEQGMVTLQQDALLKASQGLTSFEEVEKVTGAIQWGK
ncbi:MAG: GspE/PulE family protein [Candidatus Harrisonbacteria bacterium]|nr:GspE/PulE family protein [Candidatus Harrisonbacteria bacterium]